MTRHLFDTRPAALARIPLLPVPSVSAEPAVDPLLWEAVFLASRQVGEAESAVDGDRAAATLRSYDLRARWRPTPNGAFAAVAPARIGGTAASLRLGGHHAHSSPSATWLIAVADRLIHDPGVLDRVRLTTCDLVVRRGGRFELERPAAPSESGPQRSGVTATATAELIFQACATGSDASSLVTLVRERWPSAPEATVRATLITLVDHGMLLTDLLPGDLWDDPLGHLLKRLPTTHPEREALEHLRSLLASADRHRPGNPVRLSALRAAQRQADQVCAQQRPLSVNVIADAHGELPRSVADAAADAATVLWRIGDREDPLVGYHRRFAERYGRWRLVPFTELCDPVLGLGAEPGEVDMPQCPGREQALARLIARATTTGARAVTLNEADIAALGHAPGAPPPRTAEIWTRILAATPNERDAGRFFLAMSGGSQDAGSTAGRFSGLHSDLRDAFNEPGDSGDDGTLIAELVVQARVPQTAALAPPSGLAPHRIPVGTVPRDGDLRLADLHVYSDGDRLIVWSARHRAIVIPVLYSRLSPAMLPPQARLLQLLGHSGCRPFPGWSWGGMRHCPFQPRVCYSRTVLSSARWLLPPDLVTAARDRASWPQAVDAWRTETNPAPPDIVVIEDRDRLLPLDLRKGNDSELLRRHIGRGVRSVTEQPGGPDTVQAVLPGPDGNHVLELVISLDRRGPTPARQRPASPRPAGSGRHLPGGEWLSLAVRAPTHLHDQLAVRLGAAAASLPAIARWFWLRYATVETGPHLRARFHGDPAVLGGQILPALSAWCQGAVREGLCGGFSIEPYDPEIERYGGGEAIGAAEEVFAADSQLALAVLQAMCDRDQRMVMAAHSAATTALTVAADPFAAIGRHRLDRTTRASYERLRPRARHAWSANPTGIPIMAAADSDWWAWRDTLTAYHERLDDARRADCASSLIHMSANRLLGSLSDEAVIRALATDLIARTTHAEASA